MAKREHSTDDHHFFLAQAAMQVLLCGATSGPRFETGMHSLLSAGWINLRDIEVFAQRLGLLKFLVKSPGIKLSLDA